MTKRDYGNPPEPALGHEMWLSAVAKRLDHLIDLFVEVRDLLQKIADKPDDKPVASAAKSSATTSRATASTAKKS